MCWGGVDGGDDEVAKDSTRRTFVSLMTEKPYSRLIQWNLRPNSNARFFFKSFAWKKWINREAARRTQENPTRWKKKKWT